MSVDASEGLPGPNPEGEAMVAEFEWVHGLLRRELTGLRDLAERAATGADAAEVRTEIASMAVSSPVWALRVHCLHYCQFVEGHHTHEDDAWFPRLRRVNPALDPVVDRLQAEHVEVARHLDVIEEHAAGLLDDPAARPALVAALGDLADHLLRHLDYEEDSIFPTLRAMRDWRRH
jgi:iron-sulfur cluster repair protein YtfE (RIC family)